MQLLDEADREEVFRKLHGEWPIKKQYPGGMPIAETEGWARSMDEREAMVSSLIDRGSRWEMWLDLAQMRMTKNFTPTGWSTSWLDAEAHAEVSQLFRSSSQDVQPESIGGAGLAALYIKGDQDFWSFQAHVSTALRERVLGGIQNAIASWINVGAQDLEFMSAYGARIYRNNSVLLSHVDHLETHVLSAVYCIAIEGEEGPWYLGGFPDFTGKNATVDLRPGQLFLYESAKLPHGRPGTFRGDKYVAMFVHYRPKDWTLTNWDRLYTVPPGWETQDQRHRHREL